MQLDIETLSNVGKLMFFFVSDLENMILYLELIKKYDFDKFINVTFQNFFK